MERDRQKVAATHRRDTLRRELGAPLRVMKHGWPIAYDDDFWLLPSRTDPVLPHDLFALVVSYVRCVPMGCDATQGRSGMESDSVL